MDGLEGSYRVERIDGFLPSLLDLQKHVGGARGTTQVLGRIQLPFRLLRRERNGLVLRYDAPLQFLVDYLTPAGPDGSWIGRATANGTEYATFRLVPIKKKRRVRRLIPLGTLPLAVAVRLLRRRRRAAPGS